MPHVRTVVPDGERIRELRLKAELSPTQLAQRLGGKRHRQTIHRLERGEAVSVLLIHQVARALGTDPGDITRQDVAA
jgi:transcriptional regulator with XRE-family HTH domain